MLIKSVKFFLKAEKFARRVGDSVYYFFGFAAQFAICSCVTGLFIMSHVIHKYWRYFSEASIMYIIFLILSVSFYFLGYFKVKRISQDLPDRKIKITQKKVEEKIKEEKEKLNIH